jgi:MFS family permease
LRHVPELAGAALVAESWPEEKRAKAAGILQSAWAVGFFLAAIGVYLHSLWLIYIGYGVLGGFGLGIGYISPDFRDQSQLKRRWWATNSD